ncbi:orotidine-5'-phosphate decarboxylase [Rubricoccus marinus]|uniref:Orotidine 5'-phosphate decarboxylase n=1 Tax=Rubricoccus marinus TaxID=716817 RepID=A0A259TYI0_9BACT|nr:orotidine-5'-phosphate decarboxylase [Rubricoccus marinus]OZC02638.1 orotidine 5'-phosphate decarboxylase [Rubricoccus marinus]
MTPFPARLAAASGASGSVLCVGLDPDPERMPAAFASGASETAGATGAAAFCRAIVEATAERAAAFKPNLAFFEAYGPDGWDALDAVCEAVRASGRLLILDGKRGDIGNTGRRYATSLYDRLLGDASTVAPYMGSDSVAPFLEHEGRCAFVLVTTSNPGGADLQALVARGADGDERSLWRHTADMAIRAGDGLPGTVGFVAGATRPELLAEIREAYPEAPLLVPGVGAQGGTAGDVLRANAGGPILVNSSRGILYASGGDGFERAAREAASRLADSLAP